MHFEFCILYYVFLPLLVSAFIVLGSPYVGQIRSSLRSSFPDQYLWIIGGVTAIAVVGAIGWAVARVRQSRRDVTARSIAGPRVWVRYSLVIAAVVLGAGYARAVSSGETEIDLVEAFHFVEYGLVAYLFFRPLRRRPDISGVALAASAGLAAAVADEWVQWVVPGRVGELHDILLDAVAIGCGLLLGMAVHPPPSLAWPARRASRLALGAAMSGLLMAFAGFVDRVHVGYEIRDGEAAVFRSRYSAQSLAAAAANRPSRWKASPPPEEGFRQEDHYLSEGRWHAQQRTIAIGRGDWWTALHEDAILERFYAPVLQLNGRLSLEQRSAFDSNAPGGEHTLYVSDAAPYPIYLFSRPVFWMVTLLLAATVMWLASRA